MSSAQDAVFAQGGGYGPPGAPPGGYGPPGGAPPGGYGPPGGPPGGGGYGGPPGSPPGGYGGPPGGGGYGGPPGGGGYGPPGGGGGYGPPGAPPMAPPGGGPVFGGPPGMGPPGGVNQDLKKQATTWLIVAAVSAFFCGSCCFGIAGAVLCFLAMQAAEQGNAADAEAKLKWGKIITIVGIALGVLSTAAWVFWQFVYAATALAG